MQNINGMNPFLETPKDFVIPEARIRRTVQPPDYSKLKPSQAAAADKILNYLNENTEQHKAILLKGYAGTGKSYLTSFIVEWMLTQNVSNSRGIPRIAVTAPTNKAVKVGERMAEYTDDNIEYKTIHKLLGLKEVITDNGKVSFEKEWGAETELLKFDILFLDEVSMVNDELFDMIYHEITSSKSFTKLVMIGDGFQIPPVGSNDCKPFKEQYQRELQIGVIELTEIVRQTHGSPIITLATAIRERQEGILESRTDTFNENGALFYVNRNDKDLIYSICDKYFNNEYFNQYPDFMKVIAWRNATVNQINAKVRSFIYKDYPKYGKIMIGEKLIANSAIVAHGTNRILYTSNDEFVIKSFEIERRETYRNKNVVINCKFYRVITIDINNIEKEICIIHEDDESLLNTITDQLKKHAISCIDPMLRKWAWKTYYEVARHFADVKYNYAITAHKSQGSSFQNTMVLMWDILQNHKQLEAERILYVGLSRPRQNLCVIY